MTDREEIEDDLFVEEGNEQTWLKCVDGKKDVLYDLTDFLDIRKPLRLLYPIIHIHGEGSSKHSKRGKVRAKLDEQTVKESLKVKNPETKENESSIIKFNMSQTEPTLYFQELQKPTPFSSSGSNIKKHTLYDSFIEKCDRSLLEDVEIPKSNVSLISMSFEDSGGSSAEKISEKKIDSKTFTRPKRTHTKPKVKDPTSRKSFIDELALRYSTEYVTADPLSPDIESPLDVGERSLDVMSSTVVNRPTNDNSFPTMVIQNNTFTLNDVEAGESVDIEFPLDAGERSLDVMPPTVVNRPTNDNSFPTMVVQNNTITLNDVEAGESVDIEFPLDVGERSLDVMPPTVVNRPTNDNSFPTMVVQNNTITLNDVEAGESVDIEFPLDVGERSLDVMPSTEVNRPTNDNSFSTMVIQNSTITLNDVEAGESVDIEFPLDVGERPLDVMPSTVVNRPTNDTFSTMVIHNSTITLDVGERSLDVMPSTVHEKTSAALKLPTITDEALECADFQPTLVSTPKKPSALKKPSFYVQNENSEKSMRKVVSEESLVPQLKKPTYFSSTMNLRPSHFGSALNLNNNNNRNLGVSTESLPGPPTSQIPRPKPSGIPRLASRIPTSCRIPKPSNKK